MYSITSIPNLVIIGVCYRGFSYPQTLHFFFKSQFLYLLAYIRLGNCHNRLKLIQLVSNNFHLPHVKYGGNPRELTRSIWAQHDYFRQKKFQLGTSRSHILPHSRPRKLKFEQQLGKKVILLPWKIWCISEVSKCVEFDLKPKKKPENIIF